MKLVELENESAIILCQLEMYFPPTFFDIMVHLIVHLVREIKFCGPVYLQWMYPVERYMKIIKGCHTLISSGDLCLMTCDFCLVLVRCLAPIIRQFVKFRDMPENKRKY